MCSLHLSKNQKTRTQWNQIKLPLLLKAICMYKMSYVIIIRIKFNINPLNKCAKQLWSYVSEDNNDINASVYFWSAMQKYILIWRTDFRTLSRQNTESRLVNITTISSEFILIWNCQIGRMHLSWGFKEKKNYVKLTKLLNYWKCIHEFTLH